MLFGSAPDLTDLRRWTGHPEQVAGIAHADVGSYG